MIKAGKPLFIDKPIAGSLADAIVIYELAKKHNVPCFSSSSLRFGANIEELLKNEQLGTIEGGADWGPCTLSGGTPDMFFYGIHGIEPLFALMGRLRNRDADSDQGYRLRFRHLERRAGWHLSRNSGKQSGIRAWSRLAAKPSFKSRRWVATRNFAVKLLGSSQQENPRPGGGDN